MGNSKALFWGVSQSGIVFSYESFTREGSISTVLPCSSLPAVLLVKIVFDIVNLYNSTSPALKWINKNISTYSIGIEFED